MNRLRVLFAAGLIAGAALAQKNEDDHDHPSGPPPRVEYPAPPAATKARKPPKTCEQKCEAVVEPCASSCKQQKNPAAKSVCTKGCSDMEAACRDSCREKGKIDPEYIRSRVMPPEKGQR